MVKTKKGNKFAVTTDLITKKNKKMAKSKMEIEAAACEVMAHILHDLGCQIGNALEDVRVSPRVLADTIGVDERSIHAVLNGRGSMELLDYIKLLVATNNTIVVHPIPAEHRAERRMADGRMAERRIDDFDPFPTRFNEPNMRQRRAMRDAGQGQVRHEHEQRQAPRTPFDAMGEAQMKDIIRKRLWDSEIDLDAASRQDLVNFLAQKHEMMMSRKHAHPAEESKPNRPTNFADEVIDSLKEKFKSEFEANPRLKDFFRELMG